MDWQPEQPSLLFVDDERANLMLLERLFAQNYRVTSVTSGAEALNALAQSPFDLVLLDVMMPRMSGLDVLQRLRHTPETADLPVILVSAMTDRKDIVRGLHLGANDYVTKPIEAEVLFARVQTQLALKQLQDRYKQAIAELEAAQQIRDRFFRIASHDLKAPLTNISMIQNLLEEAVGDDQEAHKLLHMLGVTTQKMQGVVLEFLDMAALEAGALDVRPVEVDVIQILRSSVAQQTLVARHKNITIEAVEARSVIVADATRTGQALDNLLSNAIKYSPPGSVVRLWAEQRDGNLRICVEDQGPGIPEEELGQLFTAFGKLSPRPTNGESSTGLGLWITRHVMTLQNGEVGMDPSPNGGCIFWLELPLAYLPVTNGSHLLR